MIGLLIYNLVFRWKWYSRTYKIPITSRAERQEMVENELNDDVVDKNTNRRRPRNPHSSVSSGMKKKEKGTIEREREKWREGGEKERGREGEREKDREGGRERKGEGEEGGRDRLKRIILCYTLISNNN